MPTTSTPVANGYVIPHAADQAEVHTDILIDATPAQVWAVLTDFAHMPRWSSSFQGIEGELRDGGPIVARYLLNGDVAAFAYTLHLRPGAAFWWSAPIGLFPGLTDNHHYIVLDAGNGQTRFVQRDTYTGASTVRQADGSTAPLSAEVLASMQLVAYTQFNQELRAEVQRRTASQPAAS